MRITHRTALSLAGAAAILSCSDATSPEQVGTSYGPTIAMASGSARAYVTDRAGVPTEIGVALTEAALVGLPAANAEYVLTLPLPASTTAYKHAVINWIPLGHPPAGVYTVPHFDFHFYTITNAQRTAIVLGDSLLTAKMMRLPEAEFIPAGYVTGMASERMGLHWRDPAAPELNGALFTHTFIYGSYDGAMNFAEPMVAKTYLETKPAPVTTSLKLAAQNATHGYQATSYTVAYDQSTQEYSISLAGLVVR
jgi:hypothetical protein